MPRRRGRIQSVCIEARAVSNEGEKQGMETGPIIVGIIMLVGLIGVSILSIPIAWALGIIGLVFAILLLGLSPGIALTGMMAWLSSFSYSMAMIPLYLLMGALVNYSDLGTDAYRCFNMLLSKIRGGLSIVSIVCCGAFASISGSSTATAAAIGSIALPEMEAYGYSKSLRTGSVAIAGTLGILIPPSIAMIFYSSLCDVSVGKLFIAGIIPGIITIGLFSIAVLIWVRLQPNAAPVRQQEHFTLKQKVNSLKGPLPILILFLFLMGGIYFGFFSATEAAGIGAFAALSMVLLMRRLNWQAFAASLRETVRITAFIMMILIGANLFASTLSITRLPYVLADTILGLQIPSWGILIVIMITTVFLGCVLDSFSLMVLTVPLFLPTILALGYDPIWYGVVTVILVEIGLVTPPVASNLYVVKGIDRNATTMDVIRGIVPFFVCELILVALLIVFPQIVLFLPSLM